jgi:hypothetical protein
MKYLTVNIEGCWVDDPENIIGKTVALNKWDGIEDKEDEQIFFYMDCQPLSVGQTIAEDFVVVGIEK